MTLEVIAERGIARTSHRTIARAADVPLGSVTYHFRSLEELLAAAFARHAEAMSSALEARLSTADGPDAALRALVDHLTVDVLGSARRLVLSVELYLAAARRPALRTVTQGWLVSSRRALERHFDPVTARELDALVEGLVLHSALSTDPMTAGQIHHALHRLAGHQAE